MRGLMQDRPLDLPSLFRHAERLHRSKTISTATARGVVTTTIGEALRRARRLISALRSLGVRAGDRVATFGWNTQQHFEAYVSVPCMGAVLHTLNVRLFPDDLAYIADHAKDKVAIVDACLWPAWEKFSARVPSIERVIVVREDGDALPAGALDYEELIASNDAATELADVDENAAAAMCYTSGTTGRPKGVVYSHRSNVLHALMLAGVDTMALCERDVILPIVPMFHANAWGLPYGALMTGASLVMPGRFLQPDALVELCAARGVTMAAGVPSIWLGMLEPLKRAKPRLGRLARIGCGGSAVPTSLARAYRDELGITIMHAWGMTETSPLATVSRPLAKHDGLDGAALDSVLASQGRAVPLVELRIVGDDRVERPWDGKTPGEIEVRGPWIAREYYEDPTSPERFDGGWLRTGDVATIDEDGFVRIVDRTKDLVKSGGEWISSVELESSIMACPGVAEAAVIAVPHACWVERPLACVVAKKGASLTRDAVIDFLRPRVAKWWLPDDVVFVDEIPKTSVGKFDKKVLRERFKGHVLP